MGPVSFDGRTVAIFGGTGALGGAVVARLVADAATVVVGDAREPDADAAQTGVTYKVVNATDEASVAAFFEGLGDAPWAVINLIGGFTPSQPLAELDLAVLARQLELNVVTAATITKHAIATMSRGGDGGRIVHTSSRVAQQDGKNGFAYSVSKLAVVRLVEAAAAEVKDAGITVNCVMPSIIDTPANRDAMPKSDYSRWPKPEQIAAVFAFLTSDESVLISGAAIPVYGLA